MTDTITEARSPIYTTPGDSPAVREQVYYGWEKPLALAQGGPLIFGKYEAYGWWSEAAAALV